jgi:hypothetical protein
VLSFSTTTSHIFSTTTARRLLPPQTNYIIVFPYCKLGTRNDLNAY